MNGVKRLTPPQSRKVNALVRRTCCNYDNGNCILLDDGDECVCPQLISYSLLCKWFRVAVLPADRLLYAELYQTGDKKKCTECGAFFASTSNSVKYCPVCRKRITRRQAAERMRKRRAYCVTGAQKGEFMRTGLTKQEKTTDIWFDEKDPLIHIRTHNTDLKKRLAAYAGQYPDQCCQTDADPETGCMEFDIAKGRFSFRLTAPYSEERRNAASKAAKKHSGNLTHPIQKDVL